MTSMASLLRATVISSFSMTGFHNWPAAPGPVDYLAARHRHLFRIRVEAAVEHVDRAVEFHTMMRAVQRTLVSLYEVNEHGELEFGARSCEMIARDLMRKCEGLSAVEVWEDDECGARVER